LLAEQKVEYSNYSGGTLKERFSALFYSHKDCFFQ